MRLPIRRIGNAGWEEGLRKMAEVGEDKLKLDFPNRFDVEEWEW